MSVITMDSTNKKNDLKEHNDPNNEPNNEPADFEKAMDVAGFGNFNLLLLLIATFANCASVFQSSTMSYILPIAECDLKLTLIDKGTLNAVTYAGMITSAMLWGYVADTQGRKKVLVYGYLLDAVCVVGSSLSQNFEMLVTFKFLGGFIVNGPTAVHFTYLTELHTSKNRPRVLMVLGMVVSAASLMLPLLALAILPRDWNFVLFSTFNVHSWQIFLLVCAIPSLISGLLFTILPESPRFLMSQGRNQEALQAFQMIYSMNYRKPKETYPIKQLVEEVPNRDGNANEFVYTIDTIDTNVNINSSAKVKRQRRTFLEALRDGMQQIKPMFRKPLLGHSLHAYTMQFCIMLGLNTIRLWLPQLFASISEYEALNVNGEESSTMCTILEYSVNKTAMVAQQDVNAICGEVNTSFEMYLNNIIVSLAGLVGYFFAGTIIRLLGENKMITYGLFVSGCFAVALYWSTSSLTTLIISSCFVTVGSISTTSMLGIVLKLFPTSLRSLIVATALMFGRLGALSGNILFPVFVEIGCIPPFLMVGIVMFFASALSCILPSTKKIIST